jgi:hypothetical protein
MHLMIDIETLDNTPSAVVLSAGWAWFDREKIHASGAITFDATMQQRRLGRTVSIPTVRWWQQQTMPMPPDNTLAQLSHMVRALLASYPKPGYAGVAPAEIGDVLVWANSPSFDLVILRHWAEQTGTALPWAYRAERDFRTFRHFAEIAGTPVPVDNPSAHDAEADARYQASFMIANAHLCAF